MHKVAERSVACGIGDPRQRKVREHLDLRPATLGDAHDALRRSPDRPTAHVPLQIAASTSSGSARPKWSSGSASRSAASSARDAVRSAASSSPASKSASAAKAGSRTSASVGGSDGRVRPDATVDRAASRSPSQICACWIRTGAHRTIGRSDCSYGLDQVPRPTCLDERCSGSAEKGVVEAPRAPCRSTVACAPARARAPTNAAATARLRRRRRPCGAPWCTRGIQMDPSRAGLRRVVEPAASQPPRRCPGRR